MKKKLKFFTFNQNNSGGSFVSNETVDHFVIIQAENTRQANDKAEAVGIYFNGCDQDIDCSCCGDRWYATYGEGTDKAEVYGKPASKYKPSFGGGVIVHYANGKTKRYKHV